MSLSIALEYLLHRKRHSLLSILGVVVGVTFFIVIASMMQGTHNYFIARLIDSAPHVKMLDEFRAPSEQPIFQAFPTGLIELKGVKPREELRGIRQAERIIAALEREPGTAIAPTLQGQAFLRYGGRDVAASLIGIMPELERHASNLERDMVEGSLTDLLTNSNGIILGRELARKLSAHTGSKLSVVSPAGISRKMKVVGLFDTGVTEVDGSTSYATLKKVQILQAKEDIINQINMRLLDVDSAPELASRLERRYGWRTESWQETFANIFELFVIQDSIMYSTVLAILVVAGFGIYNIISTAVNEKSRDIAILKSMGFSEGDIRWIFVWQGIVVGVIGTILGWVLGAILIEVLATIPLHMEGEVNLPFKFKAFPMHRSIWLYIAGGGMAATAAIVSAYLPARRAASFNPVDIIRGAA